MTQTETVRAPAPRARALFSVLTLLAMCSFAALTADTAEAQLISVTSVSDGVRLKESAFELDLTAAGNVLTGNSLTRIIGSGDKDTGGYRSFQLSNTSGTSLFVGSTVEIPTTGSITPNPFPNGIGAFGATGSTILFTATSNSQYTAAGDNLFGNGNIGTYLTFILKDVTNNINLVEFTDGWNNGLTFSSTTGSLTGNLVAGHQYSWTQEFAAGKRSEFSTYGFRADGTASLNLTAVAVPEPSSVALLGLAALGMFTWRRLR